jgi:RNA polymerase sigma factor (sigma-70 family)
MEPMNQSGGAAATASDAIMPGQLQAVYTAEYVKLVKILRIMGATMDEAEDAVQKTMTDFAKRSKPGQASISNPAAYLRKAAINFFIKERQRDRERLPRELKGGHLTLPAYLDTELTAYEDEQWVEHVLESLTPAQRDVIKLVISGASTHEIAEQLGKNDVTIRQLRKTGRDSLLEHPEIAARAPRELQPGLPDPGGLRSAATTTPRKGEVQ